MSGFPGRHKRKLFVFLAAIAVASVVLYFAIPSEPPALNADGFVVSTIPTMGNSPNATLRQRFFMALWKSSQNWQRSRGTLAKNYTFGPTPTTTRCSVQGLLNQCMEVSGTRYLIKQDLVVATVQFGNTNSLRGDLWIGAFEQALETGKPEWWDMHQKKFISENFVLLRYPANRTVVVLRKEDVAEFERKNGAPPVVESHGN
jgi:hypothetical protein